YGRRAYAPPNGTTDALLKNKPSLKSVLSQPRSAPMINIGVSHSVSQRTETRNARAKFGRVCGGDSASSPITDNVDPESSFAPLLNFDFQSKPPRNPMIPALRTIAGNGALKK